MSFLPIPSEFPLPRATRADLLPETPLYKIYIVESWTENGSHQEIAHELNSYEFLPVLSEIRTLYSQYAKHSGYAFSTDSIALRMKSMESVLCWFGFTDDRKYTCFIKKCTIS